MKLRHPIRTLLLGGVTAAAVSLAAFAASAGTQSDPLVTLSYLTNQFTPSVLSQVDKQITTAQTDLEAKFDAKLQSAGGGGSSSGGVYTTVALSAGQTIVGDAGTELLLRSGSAVCTTAADPGLVDMTGGGTVNAGESIAANHLYMATASQSGMKASSSVQVMVRGGYSIK